MPVQYRRRKPNRRLEIYLTPEIECEMMNRARSFARMGFAFACAPLTVGKDTIILATLLVYRTRARTAVLRVYPVCS